MLTRHTSRILSIFWFSLALACAVTTTSGCDDESGGGGEDTASGDTDDGNSDSRTDADTEGDDTRAATDGDVEDTTDDTATTQDAGDVADSGTPDDTATTDSGGDVADTGDGFELPTGAGCSADLRDVLDANGDVVGACPSGMGCSDGACVPACDAAEASGGNVACRFRAATPPSYPPALPPCHAVFVTNTWSTPAHLEVTRGGQSYDVTQFGRMPVDGMAPEQWPAVPGTGLPSDGVAVLFLSSDPDAVMPETGVALTCPVTPAIDAATEIDMSGEDDVWKIESDVPVGAYDILPFGGAPSFFPSAQLLLPTSVWGTDYVVIGTPIGTAGNAGPMWLQVTALQDGTTVQIQPTVDLPAAGAAAATSAGATTSFQLDADRVVQWSVPASTGDPSGTLISADGPISVTAGNQFLRLQETSGPGGESTHQPVFALDALGQEYVAAPYETRRLDLMAEDVPYRIVGAVDGTTLTFEPSIAGAPATLEQGEVVDFSTTEPFVVSSQDADHPFALAQLMPTANVQGGSRVGSTTPHDTICPTGVSCPLGDEEFVTLFPPAQYLSRYVFFTDTTYGTTTLTLIRKKPVVADAVVLDCFGVLDVWQPIGQSDYEYKTIDLVRAGVPNGGCQNGRRIIESTAGSPFGVVVWGVDTYASYGYPAGGNAQVLNELPPVIN